MIRTSKKFRFILGGLGLFIAIPLVLQVGVNLLFSTHDLEEILTENLNAEVEVEKLRVSLFSREIVARGVRLSHLDSSKQNSSQSGIEVRELRLGVKFLPLFSRRLETTSLVISEPTIRLSLDEEGDWSIAELFQKPDHEEEAAESKEEAGALAAEDHGWLAKLRETRLEKGQVTLFYEEKSLSLSVDDLQIVINDLQFNPENLATLNQVEMDLSGRCQLRDEESNLLLQLELSGDAKGKLFNEKSGDFEADVLADLALGKDSYLDPRIKIARRIWSYLEGVEKLGIPLGDLPGRIEFGRSRRIVGSYCEERVTLVEPLSLSLGSWEVGLGRDSWIDTANSQHQIGMEFLAGKGVSATLGGWLEKLPEQAGKLVQERFIDDKQALWRVNSSGDLGEPKFDYTSQINDTDALIEELENSLEEEVDKIREKAGVFLRGLLE